MITDGFIQQEMIADQVSGESKVKTRLGRLSKDSGNVTRLLLAKDFLPLACQWPLSTIRCSSHLRSLGE